MNETFYIEEYSSNIPLFLNDNKIGEVHSKFENGVNIKFGNRLLFVGTRKNGKLPFGAHMPQKKLSELLKKINARSKVNWYYKRKQLVCNDGELVVSLSQAREFNSNFNSKHNIERLTTKATLILQTILSFASKTGLDLSIEQYAHTRLNKEMINNEKADILHEKLDNLMSVLFESNEANFETVLRYFLGRGRGLTPSGDDHLVGLLALQSIGAPFKPLFKETILKLIETESVTTDVAKEYLYYAVNGFFSSTVIDVLTHLIEETSEQEEKLTKLLAVGHSSGVDVLFGILLGLIALRRN